MELELEGAKKQAHVNDRRSGGANTDRLSTLPDALLHTIMSFMKAWQVVQPSVLAKRWRHLWRSVPCLDIDQKEFTKSIFYSSNSEWGKFEDFADNLLAHRSGSLLDVFRLHVSDYDLRRRCKDVGRCICCGIKCSPRELVIRYAEVPPIDIPLVFDSSSCRLTMLHLSRVHLSNHFTGQFSYLCTILEDLKLKDCIFYFCDINSPRLNNLVIDGCEMYHEQFVVQV